VNEENNVLYDVGRSEHDFFNNLFVICMYVYIYIIYMTYCGNVYKTGHVMNIIL
jgi:hypothetical protein